MNSRRRLPSSLGLIAFIGLAAIGLVACGATADETNPEPAPTDRGVVATFVEPDDEAPMAPGARRALVIGNANYTSGGVLANPDNDARAMRDALVDVGFEIPDDMLVIDANRIQIRDAVDRFTASLASEDTAFVFFAGHGIEVDGENYLLGVGFEGHKPEYIVDDDAYAMSRLLKAFSGRDGVTILVLDACRNDPFSRSWSRSTRGRGFSEIEEVPTGVYLAYSTAPEDIALDGDGENSPFTTSLATRIRSSNKELDTLFRQVRGDVLKTTQEQQRPWSRHAMVGEFYFRDQSDRGAVSCVEADNEVECETNLCESGEAAACKRLGDMHLAGRAVEASTLRAAELYDQACVGGELVACNNLGLLVLDGDGVDGDLSHARTLFSQACNGGEVLGCNNLASMLTHGEGGPEDKPGALELYRRACDSGEPLGCVNLGLMVETGDGVEADIDVALIHYERACTGGAAASCTRIGDLLAERENVEDQTDDAYNRGCESGDPAGCYRLAERRMSRAEEPDTIKLAADLYQRACIGGAIEACTVLAGLYQTGERLAADEDQAERFLKHACRADDALACSQLPEDVVKRIRRRKKTKRRQALDGKSSVFGGKGGAIVF